MTLATMIRREFRARPMRALVALLVTALAAGSFPAAVNVLSLHRQGEMALLAVREQEAAALAAELAEEMRKATLKLSFNLLILPEDVAIEDWLADDGGRSTLPADYGRRLVASGIISVRHVLPLVQRRIAWPESGQPVVLLVGIEGQVPEHAMSPRQPLMQPVPDGTVVLGHALPQSLGVGVGDSVTLMGRSFRVERIEPERGTADDVTAWAPLAEVQEMLGLPGRVDALLALECLCVGADALARIRAEVAAALPGTQVVEMGTRVLARAEARMRAGREAREAVAAEKGKQAALQARRERIAALLLPLAILLGVAWVGLMAHAEARSRRGEIAMLRAIGFSGARILALLLARFLVIGLAGGTLAWLAGTAFAAWRAVGAPGVSAAARAAVWDAGLLGPTLLLALAMMLLAAWIPALLAVRADAAEILGENQGC